MAHAVSAVETADARPEIRSDSRAAADRVRLLKFVTLFAIGGTERQVMTLAKSLDTRRYEIMLACLRRSGGLLQQMMESLPGAPPAEFSIKNLYNTGAFRERVRFARHLRAERVQIVHTYNFYPNVFALPAAKLARTPIAIASIRDMGVYLTPLQLKVQRIVCRLADRIIVNADAVKRWLVADGYDEDNVEVIRNGVDLSRFTGAAPSGRLRHDLGLPPSTPLVAAVARLSPTKGLEYFLQAAAALAAERPDVRFLVVGEAAPADRDYPGALRTYAARLGIEQRVIFTGLRLDVPELLPEVTVSVLPSLSEGLSNVVLESMAAGVPTIATRVGGNPEAVVDGVTGVLIPPGDAAPLVEAIRRLLDDSALARELGRAGRRRVLDHFALDVAVRQTERLYERLLEDRARG